MTRDEITDHELRVLSFLDQRGAMRRSEVVWELASPESKIGWRRDHGRGLAGGGSNNGEPMIMANWCKRLIREGMVRHVNHRDGFYSHHEITEHGRRLLRN